MKRFALIALALAMLLTCTAFAENGATLLFEDNFDGNTLNPVWQIQTENRGSSCYWAAENVFVDGEGNLVIMGEWDDENYMVRCGGLRTAGGFQAGYGYYEMRAKLYVTNGGLSLFHVVAGDIANEFAGAKNGVDIYVVKGQKNNQISHSFDWDGWGAAHKTEGASYSYPDVTDGEYHVFGLLRDETGYTFYVDGEKMYTAPSTVDVCNKDGYLALGLEFQTYSNFAPGMETKLIEAPAEFVVDYVKVWDKMPE